MKILGFDKLTRTLDQAAETLGQADGDIGSVQFDPKDPASIEQALSAMENMIDQRFGNYLGNPILEPIVDAMKEQYRNGILEQAATARLKAGE